MAANVCHGNTSARPMRINAGSRLDSPSFKMPGSDELQPPGQSTSRGKPPPSQVTVSQVVEAVWQLAEQNGSKLTTIRKVIRAKTGAQPSLLQVKTAVNKGIEEGALAKATKNRFRVERGTCAVSGIKRPRRHATDFEEATTFTTGVVVAAEADSNTDVIIEVDKEAGDDAKGNKSGEWQMDGGDVFDMQKERAADNRPLLV